MEKLFLYLNIWKPSLIASLSPGILAVGNHEIGK